MNQVFLVVGVPGSGKSWVCEQLTEKYTYIPHDAHIGEDYVIAIVNASRDAIAPLLIEAPFSISQIKDPLDHAGFLVECVFILDEPSVIIARYERQESRGGKPFPPVHLKRMQTYAKRAASCGAFSGTSEEVLNYLKNK